MSHEANSAGRPDRLEVVRASGESVFLKGPWLKANTTIARVKIELSKATEIAPPSMILLHPEREDELKSSDTLGKAAQLHVSVASC